MNLQIIKRIRNKIKSGETEGIENEYRLCDIKLSSVLTDKYIVEKIPELSCFMRIEKKENTIKLLYFWRIKELYEKNYN